MWLFQVPGSKKGHWGESGEVLAVWLAERYWCCDVIWHWLGRAGRLFFDLNDEWFWILNSDSEWLLIGMGRLGMASDFRCCQSASPLKYNHFVRPPLAHWPNFIYSVSAHVVLGNLGLGLYSSLVSLVRIGLLTSAQYFLSDLCSQRTCPTGIGHGRLQPIQMILWI